MTDTLAAVPRIERRAAVSNQTTPEDGENTPAPKTAKRLFTAKRVIVGTVAVVATGVLIKLAKEHYAAKDNETDESPITAAPTAAESEFAAIVQAAAEKFSKIKSVTTDGFNVEANIFTNSKKSTWEADYRFDGETGHYRYSALYQFASTPWAFGDEIGRLIRAAVAERQSALDD